MAVETFKYFIYETTNLRADYGGGAIQAFGDSAEVDGLTLTHRHICRELGLPIGHTQYLHGSGNVVGVAWAKVSDNLYPSISPYLSAAELASVVSSAPVGFVASSAIPLFQPHPVKTTIMARGDSISAGLGTTTGDTRDVYLSQAINLISGETLDYLDVSYRTSESDNYRLCNISLGSSSWANTDASGENTYPYREDIAYPQRTQTIPMNGGNCIFIYWLGTNDLSYDTGLSGADAWARAATRLTALASEFPNLKIIIGTVVKRSELSALNNRIDDYNTLLRANYLTAGAHVLMDFEAEVSQVNISTGDTTNATYYTDGTHLTTVTHGLLAPVAKTAILAAKALF